MKWIWDETTKLRQYHAVILVLRRSIQIKEEKNSERDGFLTFKKTRQVEFNVSEEVKKLEVTWWATWRSSDDGLFRQIQYQLRNLVDLLPLLLRWNFSNSYCLTMQCQLVQQICDTRRDSRVVSASQCMDLAACITRTHLAFQRCRVDKLVPA